MLWPKNGQFVMLSGIRRKTTANNQMRVRVRKACQRARLRFLAKLSASIHKYDHVSGLRNTKYCSLGTKS